MSAFLCSDLHTMTVAAALVGSGIVDAGIVETAAALRQANNAALAARYGDEPQALDSVREILAQLTDPQQLTPAKVNGLARSFRYQCAEGNVLETHPLAPKLAKLIEATGGEIREAAPWSI